MKCTENCEGSVATGFMAVNVATRKQETISKLRNSGCDVGAVCNGHGTCVVVCSGPDDCATGDVCSGHGTCVGASGGGTRRSLPQQTPCADGTALLSSTAGCLIGEMCTIEWDPIFRHKKCPEIGGLFNRPSGGPPQDRFTSIDDCFATCRTTSNCNYVSIRKSNGIYHTCSGCQYISDFIDSHNNEYYVIPIEDANFEVRENRKCPSNEPTDNPRTFKLGSVVTGSTTGIYESDRACFKKCQEDNNCNYVTTRSTGGWCVGCPNEQLEDTTSDTSAQHNTYHVSVDTTVHYDTMRTPVRPSVCELALRNDDLVSSRMEWGREGDTDTSALEYTDLTRPIGSIVCGCDSKNGRTFDPSDSVNGNIRYGILRHDDVLDASFIHPETSCKQMTIVKQHGNGMYKEWTAEYVHICNDEGNGETHTLAFGDPQKIDDTGDQSTRKVMGDAGDAYFNYRGSVALQIGARLGMGTVYTDDFRWNMCVIGCPLGFYTPSGTRDSSTAIETIFGQACIPCAAGKTMQIRSHAYGVTPSALPLNPSTFDGDEEDFVNSNDFSFKISWLKDLNYCNSMSSSGSCIREAQQTSVNYLYFLSSYDPVVGNLRSLGFSGALEIPEPVMPTGVGNAICEDCPQGKKSAPGNNGNCLGTSDTINGVPRNLRCPSLTGIHSLSSGSFSTSGAAGDGK